MYASSVKGRTLNFGVSGMLWQDSLVMIDEETESLWSHLLGKAMQGPLQGETLEVIPSIMSDWKSWLQAYPETTVMILPRTAVEYRNYLHRDPRGLLIGLTEGELSKAWDLEGMKNHPVLNDQIGTRQVLLIFDRASGTPQIYDRNVGERLLHFDFLEGKLVDRETKSQWDLMTGEALTAPLRGNRLARLPGIVSSHHAWHIFHPDTDLVRPDEKIGSPDSE